MSCSKSRRSMSILSLLLIFSLLLSTAAVAAPEPEKPNITAAAAIVMDYDTGAILYEKNADVSYYPASITKILTALVIIENCDLDDMVTFSYNAVYNVESGSSNMGALDGDQLTVRDCLYGMMLASANEAANALAEHCAGSIEAFAEMMNAKAAELGCTGSHFANPSGLNNENHYTTAHDMALITQAAIANPTFVEIDSALYWKHAPIKRYPEPDDPGNTVYAHHAMLKKNDSRYYPGAFGGKTGYTSLAGNTLVTCAERDGLTLITVILNGHQTHYQDTKTLLDYGFQNFKSVRVADYVQSYASIQDDLTIGGLTLSPISSLAIDGDCSITLPKTADFTDTEISLQYDPGDNAPSDAAARISYACTGRSVGSAWLKVRQTAAASSLARAAATLAASEAVGIPEPTTKAPEDLVNGSDETDGNDMGDGADRNGAGDGAGRNGADSDTHGNDAGAGTDGNSAGTGESGNSPALAAESSPHMSEAVPENSGDGTGNDINDSTDGFSIPPVFWPAAAVTLVLAVLITIAVLVKSHLERKEANERYLRAERRKKRLEDIGFSREEFDQLVEKRRKSSHLPKKRR